MDIFAQVKAQIPMAAVAQHFGFAPNRYGHILCPFHDDHKPSCKLYDSSYYCWSCGAGGDSINFAAKYLQLSNLDAAKYLAAAFGIPAEEPKSHAEWVQWHTKREEKRKAQERQARWQAWQDDTFRTLTGYLNRMRRTQPEQYFREESTIEYYLDCLRDNPAQFYHTYHKEVARIGEYQQKHNTIYH